MIARNLPPFITCVIAHTLMACSDAPSNSCRSEVCGGGGAGAVAGGGQGGLPSLGGISGNGGEAGDAGCVAEKVELDAQLPNVMLLVDTSASMIIPDISGQTRWQAIDDALFGAEGMVPQLQAEMRFGLTLYASSKPPGTPAEEQECPYLQESPLALDNASPLTELFRAATPRGTTPTGASVDRTWRALAALSGDEYSGPRILLLATDGEPTLCGATDQQEAARQLSATAVGEAFDGGVTTFVVAVGSELGEDHLREISNLGQGFPASDPVDRFYRALDVAALAEAFRSISQRARSCVFELNGVVQSGQESRGTVRLDEETLLYDDPDGWVLLGPSQLALQGRACEAIRQGASSLDVRFPCGTVEPK